MGRILALLYGGVAYVVFLVSFLYAIGFVGNLVVPKAVDTGPGGELLPALLIDALLLGLFAIQHSVMARPGFKRWWTTIVPQAIERSTYVLLSSLLLLLLYWQWRPLPQTIWHVEQPAIAMLLIGLFWLGWLIVLLSTFMLNHFDLFGLQQVWQNWRGAAQTGTEFRTPLLYRLVRHPIMVGFIIAFWATPTMSLGHLVFALATTGYILIALQFEERDLVAAFGDRYRDYQRQVGMLLPWPKRR